MKKILLTLLLLLFSSFTPQANVQAQGVGFELSPPPREIDDAIEKVTIGFPDLEGGEYKMCLRGDMCIIGWEMLPDNAITKFIEQGIDKDRVKGLKDFDGSPLTVCAANEGSLKTDCQDDRDYFHAGHIYLATIYQQQGDTYQVKGRAGFYVNHHMPIATVTPRKNNAPEMFDFSITLDALSKNGKKNSNNFHISFDGPGIHEEICTPDLKVGEAKKITLPTDDWLNDKDNWSTSKRPEGVIAGKYTIKLSEQINEGNRSLRADDCQGGFTYIKNVCTVDAKKHETKCEAIEDPNQSDSKKFSDLLEAIASVGESGVPLPCTKKTNVKNPLDCPEIETAIGPIALDPIGFIMRIFSIILYFAGIGALFLLIFSGYRLLTSRGNKEQIQGARQTLTSAILGLIFIIFSLVILSVIAADILKIPGFN